MDIQDENYGFISKPATVLKLKTLGFFAKMGCVDVVSFEERKNKQTKYRHSKILTLLEWLWDILCP